MEYLTTALLILILGNIIWIQARLASLDTTVKRLVKDSNDRNKGSGAETSAPRAEIVNLT